MSKRVPGHYYVSIDGGNCGIRKAKSLREAKATALREEGTNHLDYVRPATEEDVAWVLGMGGTVW